MQSTQFSDAVRSLGAVIEPISGECPLHGQFATVRLRGTDEATCPKCYEDQMRKETADAAFKSRVAHLQSISHVPARYQTAGFGTFVCTVLAQHEALKTLGKVMRAVRDQNMNAAWGTLLITGGPGTGKTHLACALANNLVSRGVSVRYTTAQEMLSEIKRAYSTDGMSEASQIERFVNGSYLLIVDEADVQRGTDNDASLVFAVVNGRYNAGRPMVVVSNQPVAAMPVFLGDRVASRLMENSVQVVCDWADYRRKA
jgi:DNA replication protein DnaC